MLNYCFFAYITAFLFTGANCLVPQSSIIEFVNKTCFNDRIFQKIEDEEMKLIRYCRKDIPTKLAINAYIQEFFNEGRIAYLDIDSTIERDVYYLFMTTLQSSVEGKLFFANVTVNQIDWYGVNEVDRKFQDASQPLTKKYTLQRILNAVFEHLYFNLNISQIFDQLSIRHINSELMTKSDTMREISVLAAILHSMHIKENLQNPELHKIAFLLYEFNEKNQLLWHDAFLNDYIREVADLIPECLKIVVFSNQNRIVMMNKYYNYPYGFNCEVRWNRDKTLWDNINGKSAVRNGIRLHQSISTSLTDGCFCYTWEITKQYDGIHIHGSVLTGLTDTKELFHFIPSVTDPTSCYIKPVISNEFLYMNVDMNTLRKTNLHLWDENFMWKIYTI